MAKKLVLVGTSHIAKQSVDTVRRSIEQYSPEIVGVELDIGRYKGLLMEQQQKKPSSRGAMYSIRKIGFKGYAFAMFGSWGMKKLAKYVGTNPGVDMLEAIRIAKKKDKKVYLIDQNINITLKRFSKALTIKEIGKFFIDMIRGAFNPKKEMKRLGFTDFDLRKVPDEKVIENMMGYMEKRYPSIYNVLVHERNIYMAKKIIRIMEMEDVAVMVAVIGAGHRKGMARILEEQPKAVFDIVIV